MRGSYTAHRILKTSVLCTVGLPVQKPPVYATCPVEKPMHLWSNTVASPISIHSKLDAGKKRRAFDGSHLYAPIAFQVLTCCFARVLGRMLPCCLVHPCMVSKWHW